MRVVAIRGCDLASLQGEFAIELDRPPLSGLGLFAIHGPVGAGKSTLLDALCLGLYGRTPRLSGLGGAPVGDDDDELKSNDPRTLVRRGAQVAYAEVDFIGVEGRLYRARWEVKRGRKKNGRQRLQGEKQSLVDVMSGLRIGDTNTEVRAHVQARLGLSFDELCRSVLLAQGGFQGFLQAKPNERGALLEKVTGTALYSRLSMAAHERGRQLRDEETALLLARGALQILDADTRQQREAEAITASMAACAAEDASARLASELETARARAALVRAVDDATRVLHKAKATESAAFERRKRAADALGNAVAAVETLRPLLEIARQLDARLEALSTTPALGACRLAEVQDAQARAQFAHLQQQLGETQQRKDSARADMDDDVAAFVDVIDGIVVGLERLERARLEVEGAKAITAAAAAALQQADVDVDAQARVVEGLAPVRPPVLLDCDLDAVLAGLLLNVVAVEESRQQRLSHDLCVARQVRERLLRALSKTQERALLEEGEPCPLCGSAEHPWSHGLPLHPLVDEEATRIAALEQEQRTTIARLADARARLLGLPAPLLLAETVEIDVVEALRTQERAVLQARRWLQEALNSRDELARAHVFQLAALAAKESAVVDVEAGLRGLHVRDADLGDPRRRKKTLLAEVKRFAKAREIHAAAVSQEARLGQEIAGAGARVDACAAALSSTSQALSALQLRREGLVAERAAILQGDVVVVEASLARARADAAAGANDAQHALAEAQASSSTAQAVLSERLARLSAGPSADVGALEVEAAAARAVAGAARERHALLRAGLQHDSALSAKAEVVDKALAAHRQAAQVWWELAAVIGSADGARFRQFAQGLTLDALVVHANEHLKILARRYRLQRVAVTAAKHDLELVVVDIESGDEVRSTSTLSGGEAFLVSLALALGLSSLSANEGARGRVESLFIDEGFSALDADTLDVALSAFDALRQTGRQIGVISHVPLLVERIGAQVRIVPVGGGASRVEIHAG